MNYHSCLQVEAYLRQDRFLMFSLPQDCLDLLRLHVERSYPKEGCGILLGSREDGCELVRRVIPTPNAASEPEHRFVIAPEALIAAQKMAREQGLQIVGFFHSHPDRTAEPSDLDLRQAEWTGCIYLVCAVLRGELIAISGARLIERRRWEAVLVEPAYQCNDLHCVPAAD
jgi:proteasome lid subunit RPN8/RPN11